MALRVEGEIRCWEIVRGLVQQIRRDGAHVHQADRLAQHLLKPRDRPERLRDGVGMGGHENSLRRNRIRLVVLKHHASGFGGIGHDFDPLVDQQASKRGLREIDGFGHMDNQR